MSMSHPRLKVIGAANICPPNHNFASSWLLLFDDVRKYRSSDATVQRMNDGTTGFGGVY